MAALAHAHVKHAPRQQENVVHVRSMSSNSDEHLPSYLPEDELDACLRTIPSNSQEHFLHPVNPERFTSSEEYGDLYRSSSNSSNQRVLQPGSLSTQYPSYLPESDEDTEGHGQLYSSGRPRDINYGSQFLGNTKLHARSGRHSSVKTDSRKSLNGVKKSVMQQVNREENRNKKISQDYQRKESSHLSSSLGSLSSYLSNSFEDEEVHVSPQKSTGSTHKDVSPGGLSIHESVGRLSLNQRTQSGDSVDSCQSAKAAFAQELGEASREKSMTRANSKNLHMDQLDSSANDRHAVAEELPEGLRRTLRSVKSSGTANDSPQQQVQMPSSTPQQTPMQTHTNTPPMQIPVTPLQAEGSSSARSYGNQGQSLGPTSGWSFHLPGNGMRVEVPKSKPSYSAGVLKEDEKDHQDSLLRSLLPSQVTSHLSEEELVKEAKMTALKTALTRLVQEKPSYLDSDPESLLSQLSDLIFPNQENEPGSRNCVNTLSLAPLSLQSMVSQSLGSLQDMLSTASTMTNVIGAGHQQGAMAPPANQRNPSSQAGHSMTNQLLSTIFISQPEAATALTNEQNELLTTLQSATARMSLVQDNIQSERANFSHTAGEMKNGQESQQHHHTRLLDILELLCPEFMKHVLVGAAYCNGRCKQPNCMLGSEVLSYLVECVKEGTVLRCRGCSLVLSYLLDHHVPRCTERRCPVPYCVHLQTGLPSSMEKAVDRISSETFSAVLCTEIVAQTSGNQNFQWLSEPDPGVRKLDPVLPLGTFSTSILARAQDKYVTVKQMKESCLNVLRRLDHHSTPHIIKLFWMQSAENCQEELQVCAAFEQGGSLQSLLPDHDGLKTGRMWQYVQQVVQAVVYLHNLDIVYLAWTADNIVLDSSHQRAKLSNFSYAVQLTEEPDEEACVQAVTGLPPQVLAPEVHNDLSACHRSDLWGLGCLMFQLGEGRLPYPHLSHDHPDSIRQKIAEEGELPRIPESWQGQERELLEACWQEEAALRPSVQEFQALLARY